METTETSEILVINNKFQRGSEWRRWDMQIHTPYSYLNNGFGADWDKYVQKLFKKAIANDVKVIGITDYFIVDGYKKIKADYLEKEQKLKELFSDDEILKLKDILLLPNVEFRLNKQVESNRINYHIIFSDKVSLKDIEENFLHEINFVYEGGPQSESEKRKLKFSNLESLGSKLKKEHAHFASKTDIEVGMMCAVVDNEEIEKILANKRSIFEGNYVVALPCDEDLSAVSWNGQDHQARKVLVQNCDFFVSHNPKTILWGLGKTYPTAEHFKKEFKSIKPCIGGSDAHSFEELFEKNKERKFWVKADTTFAGLRQILNEPERSFIGELPPILKRVSDYPTKYIDKLTIQKVASARTTDVWFDNFEIELNQELTAIIGNKGKGKSALADIIGLCGNSHNSAYFSFLNDKKFRKPQPLNLATEFTASLTWRNGHTDTKGLNDIPTDTYEKVKYLPQNFLEALCTNIDKRVFEEELEKVIFSRLDDAEKIGRGSLREIINYRKEIIENTINIKKSELARVNSDIAELERKNSDDFRKTIKDSIVQKEAELNAHQEKKPEEKQPPQDNPEQKEKNEKTNALIAQVRSDFEKIQRNQEEITGEKGEIVQELADLKKLKQTLQQLDQSISQTVAGTKDMIEKFSLSLEDVIQYNVHTTRIDDIILPRQTRLTAIEFLFSPDNEQNFKASLAAKEVEIKRLQNDLDTPNKEYQKYLTALGEWTALNNNISGDATKEGSLLYYKNIETYIETKLLAELSGKIEIRKNIALEIINKKHEIIDIYKELYRPVTEFIGRNQNEISEYNVNIDVTLNLNDFPGRFFNYVSNGIAGSFVGAIDSRMLLSKLTRVVNFDDKDAVVSWLGTIVEHLHFDKREGLNNMKREVRKQLKGTYTEQDFYNFLFGLDYLEPCYELRLADKTLSELSPGERGALLLIFYLLLDKDDIPIIIDQPEENLDNQSVYKILVPFIKKAKSKRQIIIVTHNPNIAVVCDADQIIRTDIDKRNKNTFSVKAGAMEDTSINAETIDVLEGTRPALLNRTSKYDIFKGEVMQN